MSNWYTRTVIFVDSVERAIAFYTQKLGFSEGPSYAEGGRLLVGEVNREDCTLLIDCQQPDKTGRARQFISLEAANFLALREEFTARGVDIREGWWGYEAMVITDPDGNELYFPYPEEVVRDAQPQVLATA
jgi:catechol 2,3-dioxygenase-like lactoylglutathione lyase family enzyme